MDKNIIHQRIVSKTTMSSSSITFISLTISVLALIYKRKKSQLRIGTRKSALAMIQTEHVASLIRGSRSIAIQVGVEALGDLVLNESLASLAAKTPGLFTKELEGGLLMGQYDFVVHSLKDMPTKLPEGLCLAAITEREDPRDALVVQQKHRGVQTLARLPPGAIVGTSSVRREAIIKRDFPHLIVKMVRGNVGTRLSKLDSGEYDALILASAGLVRLSLQDRIEAYLDPSTFMYGVGQGALGLECKTSDTDLIALLRSLANHHPTEMRCVAERALLRTLQGGCQVPLGVHSRFENNKIFLECTVLSHDGKQSIEDYCEGTDPELVGRDLANKLLNKGAREFIDGGAPRPLTYGKA